MYQMLLDTFLNEMNVTYLADRSTEKNSFIVKNGGNGVTEPSFRTIPRKLNFLHLFIYAKDSLKAQLLFLLYYSLIRSKRTYHYQATTNPCFLNIIG